MAGEHPGERGETAGAPPHYATLVDLIGRLPIPSHPPRYWRQGAEYGAAFLDMALRQNHLLRLSERLHLTEVANLARRVTLDISLDRLTTGQLAAARGFGAVRQRGRDDAARGGAGAGPGLIWVAVARLARADTAPLAVVDAEDRELPRLTQDESRALLDACLYRVLRMVLLADPDSGEPGTHLNDFLHESNRARWLLQSAIVQLVERGPGAVEDRGSAPPPLPPWLGELRAAQAPARGPAEDAEAYEDIRALAVGILDEHLRDHHAALFELLDVAVSDYLLIVGLDPARAEHILTFDGPLLSAAPSSAVNRRRHRLGNTLPTSSHELVVEYETELPPGLPSYHLSLEVDPSVKCRRFLQRTTADDPIERSAVRDLQAVADHLEQSARDDAEPEPKLVEYELQSAVQRVGRLVQARLEDFSRYRAYLLRNQVRFSSTERESALELGVASAAVPGSSPEAPDSFGDLVLLTAEHGAGRLTRLYDLEHDERTTLFETPGRLRRFADVVEALELGADATADNDPRENGAHTYWKRRAWPDEIRPRGASTATVRFTLADDAPSLSGSVVRMIGILAATLYLIFAFLLDNPWWPVESGDTLEHSTVQSDALITVLLLVPGLLLARLDLPSTNTVVGYLRAAPRALAFASVGVMLVVSIATAAGLETGATRPWWALGGLILLLLAFGLAVAGAIRSMRNRSRSSLDALDPPAWLRELAGGGDPPSPYARLLPRLARQRVRPAADVAFSARGDQAAS